MLGVGDLIVEEAKIVVAALQAAAGFAEVFGRLGFLLLVVLALLERMSGGRGNRWCQVVGDAIVVEVESLHIAVRWFGGGENSCGSEGEDAQKKGVS